MSLNICTWILWECITLWLRVWWIYIFQSRDRWFMVESKMGKSTCWSLFSTLSTKYKRQCLPLLLFLRIKKRNGLEDGKRHLTELHYSWYIWYFIIALAIFYSWWTLFIHTHKKILYHSFGFVSIKYKTVDCKMHRCWFCCIVCCHFVMYLNNKVLAFGFQLWDCFLS